MDPVTGLAIAAVGSSALSGFSAIQGGRTEAARLKSQAKMQEYNAKIAELRGKQVSADRREELNSTLAAINTIRASRGVGMDSPNAAAIRKQTREQSQRAETREVLSERLGAVSARTEASQLRGAAPFAVLSGFAKGASHFVDAASTANSQWGS